jgi:hypothetical protein
VYSVRIGPPQNSIPVISIPLLRHPAGDSDPVLASDSLKIVSQWPTRKIVFSHAGGNHYHRLNGVPHCTSYTSGFCPSHAMLPLIASSRDANQEESILMFMCEPDKEQTGESHDRSPDSSTAREFLNSSQLCFASAV